MSLVIHGALINHFSRCVCRAREWEISLRIGVLVYLCILPSYLSPFPSLSTPLPPFLPLPLSPLPLPPRLFARGWKWSNWRRGSGLLARGGRSANCDGRRCRRNPSVARVKQEKMGRGKGRREEGKGGRTCLRLHTVAQRAPSASAMILASPPRPSPSPSPCHVTPAARVMEESREAERVNPQAPSLALGRSFGDGGMETV